MTARWRLPLPRPRPQPRHGPSLPGTPVRFHVSIDGQPPSRAHGTDTDADGVLTQQRMHQLIRQPRPITERTFKITFPGPGAGLAGQIAAMRRQGDEMWARAGREIAAACATYSSPLLAFAALAAPPPLRHV